MERVKAFFGDVCHCHFDDVIEIRRENYSRISRGHQGGENAMPHRAGAFSSASAPRTNLLCASLSKPKLSSKYLACSSALPLFGNPRASANKLIFSLTAGF